MMLKDAAIGDSFRGAPKEERLTTEQKKDWATDYDIFDHSYIKDPFPVWDELREMCPVAHTERWGGSWMPTRYADLFAIAQDFQHFSSRDVLVAPMGAGPPAGGG